MNFFISRLNPAKSPQRSSRELLMAPVWLLKSLLTNPERFGAAQVQMYALSLGRAFLLL